MERPVPGGTGLFLPLGVFAFQRDFILFNEQRHNEQGHDIDDLDHGVHGRAGGVFVGVAHGVAGDRGFMGV